MGLELPGGRRSGRTGLCVLLFLSTGCSSPFQSTCMRASCTSESPPPGALFFFRLFFPGFPPSREATEGFALRSPGATVESPLSGALNDLVKKALTPQMPGFGQLRRPRRSGAEKWTGWTLLRARLRRAPPGGQRSGRTALSAVAVSSTWSTWSTSSTCPAPNTQVPRNGGKTYPRAPERGDSEARATPPGGQETGRTALCSIAVLSTGSSPP